MTEKTNEQIYIIETPDLKAALETAELETAKLTKLADADLFAAILLLTL